MNEDAFNALKDDLGFLETWEDRYRYIIELGQALPILNEEAKIESNKVQGCASQVWLTHTLEETTQGKLIHFQGESDAHIVQGLVAIALKLFSGVKAQDLAIAKPETALQALGLSDHLSSQRANGLKSLLAKMVAHAKDEMH